MLTCSAIDGEGVDEVWAMVLEHRAMLTSNGHLAERRRGQAREWLHELILSGLRDMLRTDARARRLLAALEPAVTDGSMSAFTAARSVLDLFRGDR